MTIKHSALAIKLLDIKNKSKIIKKIAFLILFLMVSCQERDINCNCKTKLIFTHLLYVNNYMIPQYKVVKTKCEYCKMKEKT